MKSRHPKDSVPPRPRDPQHEAVGGTRRHVAPPNRRIGLLLLFLPLACTVLYLGYGSRQYHWDTLERSYLLEHPARYLHTWDGTPRSQFLSFAHVLELPMAWPFTWLQPERSGLRALVLFEAAMTALALFTLGALAVFWGAGLPAALLAQASLGAALAFWKMGSSGEERIAALAAQLLFLLLFWRALATGRGVRAVAAALALAVLTHLTGAVLVPFAFLALLLLPPEWCPQRSRVRRALLAGSVAAGVLYYAVAAWTTHVRGPEPFFGYLSFFHRAHGVDFFEAGGTAQPGAGPRLARIGTGIGSFFAAGTPVRLGVFALLAAAILLPFVRRRPAGSTPRRTLLLHCVLLAALWSLHFAFYEPQNHESWTLPCALLLLAAAVSLPRGRLAWSGALLPVLLVTGNASHFASEHEPMEYDAFRGVLERRTRPGDLVVMVGGIQNGRAVRGSIWMRSFLAQVRDREFVSLYDVAGVTQPDYWGQPFRSAAELQRALDSGRRAYFPSFILPEVQRAAASGRLHLEYEARGDSLFEITGAQ